MASKVRRLRSTEDNIQTQSSIAPDNIPIPLGLPIMHFRDDTQDTDLDNKSVDLSPPNESFVTDGSNSQSNNRVRSKHSIFSKMMINSSASGTKQRGVVGKKRARNKEKARNKTAAAAELRANSKQQIIMRDMEEGRINFGSYEDLNSHAEENASVSTDVAGFWSDNSVYYKNIPDRSRHLSVDGKSANTRQSDMQELYLQET